MKAPWKHDNDPRLAPGLFRSVDYSARVTYRRPPQLYQAIQSRLGPACTRLGIGPGYAVTLEVPGRRTGVIRSTTLVRVDHDGEQYLVSLAGESQWVRNVRAANGQVVIGRRQRQAATLVEVPVSERAEVIHAYLRRPGRGGTAKVRVNEARYYFGLSAHAPIEEIRPIVEHYPVFRIVPTTGDS